MKFIPCFLFFREKKNSLEKKKMGKFNFYAVLRGRTPGVYKTWKECSSQVTGYSGAEYKGFHSEEDARKFAGLESRSRKAESILERSSQTKKPCRERTDFLRLYTDGSCSPNPGPGGWAVIVVSTKIDLDGYLVDGSFIEKESSYEKESTNNRMELSAALSAVKYLVKNTTSGEIITDSQYVQNGITGWIKKWKTNGWKTTAGTPVKNEELWRNLDSECIRIAENNLSIKWLWTRGHATNKYNEMADTEANKARQK
jgi:ribonuclease HI